MITMVPHLCRNVLPRLSCYLPAAPGIPSANMYIPGQARPSQANAEPAFVNSYFSGRVVGSCVQKHWAECSSILHAKNPEVELEGPG